MHDRPRAALHLRSAQQVHAIIQGKHQSGRWCVGTQSVQLEQLVVLLRRLLLPSNKVGAFHINRK